MGHGRDCSEPPGAGPPFDCHTAITGPGPLSPLRPWDLSDAGCHTGAILSLAHCWLCPLSCPALGLWTHGTVTELSVQPHMHWCEQDNRERPPAPTFYLFPCDKAIAFGIQRQCTDTALDLGSSGQFEKTRGGRRHAPGRERVPGRTQGGRLSWPLPRPDRPCGPLTRAPP